MRYGVALLALLVVLAGCAAPVTDDWIGAGDDGLADDGTATPRTDGATTSTEQQEMPRAPDPDAGSDTASSTAAETPDPSTPTPRTEGKVAVSGRSLDVDEEAIYRAVVAMHGRSYETAPEVRLRVKERAAPSRTNQVWETSDFMALWGFDPSAMNETSIAGLAIGTRVFLYTGPVPTRDGRRGVLAHEYTHVLQHDTGAFQRTMTGVRAGDGNTRRVYLAVVEGSATYAQERYLDEHLNASLQQRTWAAFTENRSRFGAYVVAPYFFGPRYVRQRVDSVEELPTLYDRPPRTTEQVIHGYGPDEEPARPLSVDVDEGPETDWRHEDERIRGELFVRLVLEGELDRGRAADAAKGWGADRVVSFGADGTDERAHAWVLRWDDADEADEFAAAMRDYLDARGEHADDRWVDGGTTFDLRRTGDESLVVLAGPDGFVDGVTVTGTNDTVTVDLGGQATRWRSDGHEPGTN